MNESIESLFLPEQIKKHLYGMDWEAVEGSYSRAKIYRFFSPGKSYYLKIGTESERLDREYGNLTWLRNKLPVPEVVMWHSDSGLDYLLISELKGKTLFDEFYVNRPELFVKLLADGINMLRTVNIEGCPVNNSLENLLGQVAENVRLGRVNMEYWENYNNRFALPEELLDYLIENKPAREEPAFIHGDYCPVNIIGSGESLAGFIDLAKAGVADIWRDIAVGIRTLWCTLYTTEYDALFLEKIGVPLDKEKLDYYMLLDKLC